MDYEANIREQSHLAKRILSMQDSFNIRDLEKTTRLAEKLAELVLEFHRSDEDEIIPESALSLLEPDLIEQATMPQENFSKLIGALRNKHEGV